MDELRPARRTLRPRRSVPYKHHGGDVQNGYVQRCWYSFTNPRHTAHATGWNARMILSSERNVRRFASHSIQHRRFLAREIEIGGPREREGDEATTKIDDAPTNRLSQLLVGPRALTRLRLSCY